MANFREDLEILPLPIEESTLSKAKINQLLKKYSPKERTFRNKFELTLSDDDVLPQSTEEHTANTNEPTNDTSQSMASENTMSTRSKTPTVGLSEAEMLERARKRKLDASGLTVTPSSMGAPKVAKTTPPTNAPKPTKTPLAEGETFTISLPKNFCEITALTIFPSAEKLAFPAPQRRLASLPLITVANEGLALQLHATQNSLALRSATITLEKECKTLRDKLDRSSSALTAAEKKVTELSAELAKEINQNASHVASMTSPKEETDAMIAGLREELMDAASRYTWKTKARLMKQFMDGQTSKWTPEADVRQFLEVFGTPEDLVPEGENSADVTATADSGVNTETDGVA
ncbi:uncharacterized protein LOC104893500 [Beta vulgaris subsp. vulgaris]|uniref:uncharacterized protein LOC104893500 n=1 Tax=Beta vulgaris subsp. vulgaris TaxID=3555 RepID=UPI00053F538E|nr:uncharacterized protein LOC104893500 [Beta vulgaris subsp. vulgaris]